MRNSCGGRAAFVSVLAVVALVAGCGGSSEDDRSASSSDLAGSSGDTKYEPGELPGTVLTSSDLKRCSTPNATVGFGSNFELSGQLSAFGLASSQGVELATNEINEEGGFTVGDKCYKIDLVKQDNRSDAASAVAQIRGLINDRNIRAMFGPAVGSLALLTAAVTQRPEPPAINISGGGLWELEGLIGKQDTRGLFKTSEGQHTVARLFSQSIREAYPDAKTVSLLYRNDSTGVAVVKTLEPALAEVGLEIVSNDLFSPETTDFSSFIARVKSANPDVFFYGYIPTDDITITRQVVQLGLPTDLAVWQGQVSMALETATGKEIPNTFLALYDGVQMENPLLEATADYKKRFEEQYKVDGSSFFSLWQYDYVYMIAKAMQDARTVTDTDAIREKLLPMRWDGPQGPLCWNKDQNVVTGLDSALVKRGEKVTWSRQPFTVEDCRSQ